ncbi:HlyD family secretion protein [Dyadobacter sp. SG02]|uniref:HlyD family efflux transporter periplasmic adaptor subunit n=1 Tax=Dyadobacter sp. SG02 TaxID=1855291 RepID=UPI0008BCC397|nr:HlyD family efflux transporter periplasmic adaptor subunit [Dyadobacter sp. SG02]SEJ79011.1 HlyD family secretion protein [Dyadobacter sp. SG02]
MHENRHSPQTATEEVEDIVGTMPKSVGLICAIIVSFVIVVLITSAHFIRYPETIVGDVTVSNADAPIKLVSATAGKLKLLRENSNEPVSEGTIVAYIQNSANFTDVLLLDSLLNDGTSVRNDVVSLAKSVPTNLLLGELTPAYFAYVEAIAQLRNYKTNRQYEKLISSSQNQLKLYSEGHHAAVNQLKLSNSNFELALQIFARDSILFTKRALSPHEFDQAKMKVLSAKESVESATRNLYNVKDQIGNADAKLNELLTGNLEKRDQIKLDIAKAQNELLDNIKIWKEKYLFVSPSNGNLQFNRFWIDDQFVLAGESIFTILPGQRSVYGQVVVPTLGAGKILAGQRVLVSLDDYPYMEYGYMDGKIMSLSLTTSRFETTNGELNNYLATIEFPRGLVTSSGAKLNFRHELHGKAEIVINGRRLWERLLENVLLLGRYN